MIKRLVCALRHHNYGPWIVIGVMAYTDGHTMHSLGKAPILGSYCERCGKLRVQR